MRFPHGRVEILLRGNELRGPAFHRGERAFHRSKHDSVSVAPSSSFPSGEVNVSTDRLPDHVGEGRSLRSCDGTKLLERLTVDRHDDAVHAHAGFLVVRSR
jgi:hypothetical protein